MYRVGFGLLVILLVAAACDADVAVDAVAGGSSSTTMTAPGSTTRPPPGPTSSTTAAPVPTITTLVTFGGEEPPIVVSQPVGCDSEPGSPVDLESEPAEWLAFGRYRRWTDKAGCSVRVDVISHTHGAAHCDWESAQFISIGRSLGDSINERPRTADSVNRYAWDPQRVLPGGPLPDSADVADLAETVYDTGFRQDERGLWLDSADATVLYVVYEGRADIWVRSPGLGICA